MRWAVLLAAGCTRTPPRVDAEAPRARDVAAVAPSPARSSPPWRWAVAALDLPPGAPLPALSTVERVAAPGLTLDTVHRFARHGRGRVACQFDVARRGVACVTDALSDDWRVKGARLVRFDAARGAVAERLVAGALQASFLWGDFNRDGWLDFWGFADETEEADARAVLYVGTADPWAFRPTRPLAIDHPVLGGAVLDADADGCEDVLVLGTGWEFRRGGPVVYYRDTLYAGDCRGGFAPANRALGLDRVPDFEGETDAPPRLGRVAVVTDLDGDRCADLVVGNYRAHPDTFVRRACGGSFEAWRRAPDDPWRETLGHAVGLFPWDDGRRGALDLHVFNLWHDDWRGRFTDRSYRLATTTDVPRREELPQPLEAPLGAAVADFDGDGRSETLLATGTRGQPYTGPASLWRGGREVWHDARGWLRLRETPAVTDVNLDGAPDLVGDGRVLAQPGAGARRWIGFVFVGRSASGSVAVVETDRDAAAFALAADGRGQPSNLLTVGLGARARPRRLMLYEGATGRAASVPLDDLALGRYHAVRGDDAAAPAQARP
ncbi:MAG: hypothetical protein U0324_21445 [Polyangiales bacterium]